MTWKDIKVKDFFEIQKINNNSELDEFDKSLLICSILFPSVEFSLSMPYKELSKYLSQLDLTPPDPKKCMASSSYIVGDLKLKLISNVSKITTGQFIDYSNYSKMGKTLESVCVFLQSEKECPFQELVNTINLHMSAYDFMVINFTLQRKFNKLLLTFANSFLWKMIPTLWKNRKKLKQISGEYFHTL